MEVEQDLSYELFIQNKFDLSSILLWENVTLFHLFTSKEFYSILFYIYILFYIIVILIGNVH